MGKAATAMALGVATLALAVAALWLGWDGGSLLLLGFAAGALVLAWPQTARAAARPLARLARTARPLLLPLLVVVAVGTVRYSAAVQVLVSAAMLVLAWKLIVAPEARKSEVRWEPGLLRKVFGHSAIAIVAGIAVVLTIGLAGVDNPYFEALGDVPAGLLAVAIVVWVAAFGLRLFSYAKTPLRIAFSVAIGLALLALAAGAGVLPGGDIPGDAWPTVAGALGLVALALLAVEVVCSAVAGEDGARPAGTQLVRLCRAVAGYERGADPGSRAAAEGRGAAGPGRDGPAPAARSAGGGEREPGQRWPIARRAAGAGFSAAAVAAVVLAVSTVYGLAAAADRGDPLNPPEEESADARTLPPAATEEARDLELARRYAPVLAFSAGERWAPERVDSYVADATLSGPGERPVEAGSVADLEAEVCERSGRMPADGSVRASCMACPEFGESRCYELSIGCEGGGDPCARGRRREEGRLYRDGAVYVRVLRKGRRRPEEPRGAFVARGPYRDRLEALVQYWFFYRYNEWRAPVFAGLLIQRHEADWEAVTIGFDGEGRPLFVADSAHCAGSWSPWREVEASTRLPGPRTHPLVAVAEGSHANYPDPEEQRSPDWASCAGAPAGATTAVSFASNIRDRTGYGWLWHPPDDGWVQVTAARWPMDFPGTWGADDRIVLRNFRSHRLGEGAAPATPSLQPLWREPVRVIFCGRYEPRRCARGGA